MTFILIERETEKETTTMLQYFAYVLILATIVSKLEGYQVEYKISSTNCNFTDIAIRHWTTSLAMCAALCTQAAVCNGFTRKGDDCALLETCPPSCNVATEIDDRRTVHCLAGKIYYMPLKYQYHLTAFLWQKNTMHLFYRFLPIWISDLFWQLFL